MMNSAISGAKTAARKNQFPQTDQSFPRQINLSWVVQTRSQKYSPFQLRQISGYFASSRPGKRAYRDRHERGTGCGGRGGVGAQGDRRADFFRERFAACKTNVARRLAQSRTRS
jgi:hypothetical protein